MDTTSTTGNQSGSSIKESTSTNGVFSTLQALKIITEIPFNRSLPIIILVGYIIIAFSGHMSSLKELAYYSIFIIFTCLISYSLFFN